MLLIFGVDFFFILFFLLIINYIINNYPWSEEEVEVFVQENLVLRVSSAEVLEKGVSQGHDLVHLLVILQQDRQTDSRWGGGLDEKNGRLRMSLAAANLLVGDLQQVQHHSVGTHVLQQPLLLQAALLTGIAQLAEPKQDLNITHKL